MSATFFNWAVLHKSDVIESMADKEDAYENEKVREQPFRLFLYQRLECPSLDKNKILIELLDVEVYHFILALKKMQNSPSLYTYFSNS